MTEGISQPTVTPYLTVNNAKAAIKFYEEVFDAQCTFKMDAEDGERLMHATLLLRGHPLNLSDEFPEFGGHSAPDMQVGSPVAIGVRFDDVTEIDRIYGLALEKGGKNSHPPEDMFWGDRFCQFYDPFGHRWMLTALLPQS